MSNDTWIGISREAIGKNGFGSPVGLAAALAIVNAAFLSARAWEPLHPIMKYVTNLDWAGEGAVLVSLNLLTLLVWAYVRKIPRINNGTGILFAVTAETEEERIRFQNDFIAKLEQRCTAYRNHVVLKVVSLRAHQAKVVAKTLEQVAENLPYLRQHVNPPNKKANKRFEYLKSRGYGFFVWGKIETRQSNGKNSRIFELESIVCFKPLQNPALAQIEKDICTTVPRNLIIPIENEYKGLVLSADYFGAGVEYTIGRAAMASGDYKKALGLHELLCSSHKNDARFGGGLASCVATSATMISRDELLRGNYVGANEMVDKALKYDVDSYPALILKGFLLQEQGKSNEALNVILKARSMASEALEWRFSAAFLFFVMGNYEKGLAEYNKIAKKRGGVRQAQFDEIVSYCQRHHLKHPQDIFIDFILGFLNYKVLVNADKAASHFKKFIESSIGRADYRPLIEKSNAYIKEIVPAP